MKWDDPELTGDCIEYRISSQSKITHLDIHRWESYGEEPVVDGINSSTAIVFHSGTSAVSEVLIPD